MTLRLADGSSHALETQVPLGAPGNQLSTAQQEAKFRDCAANAVTPIAPETIDQALAILSGLETASGVSDLIGLFVPI